MVPRGPARVAPRDRSSCWEARKGPVDADRLLYCRKISGWGVIATEAAGAGPDTWSQRGLYGGGKQGDLCGTRWGECRAGTGRRDADLLAAAEPQGREE